MDFLNRAYAQIADLFRSMTPGARLTAGLLLAVVVVSVGYLFNSQVSGPSCDLMNGVQVTPNEVNNMVAAFGKAKLTSFKVDGSRILVPRGQESTYMAALADNNALPVDFSNIMDDELKNSNGFGNAFISTKDKEDRRKKLLEKKLGLSISRMNGIQVATVLYDTDTKGFNRDKIITASVFVQPKGSGQLDSETVSKIRHFVKSSIAGLKVDDVTVCDANGRTWSGNSENGGNADDDPYMSRKRAYEKELKSKILDALSYIPNVSVVSTVTLDKEKYSKIREIKNDPKPTTIRESEQSTSRTQDSTGPAGRPGYASQQPNVGATLGAGSGGGTKEEEENSKRETVSVPSGSQKESESVGLTPKLAKVSIGIPISYYKKVWQQRNPAADEKDAKGPDQAAIDQIRTEVSAMVQKHVAQLLPPSESVSDPTELVAVSTFQDIPGKEIIGPTMAQSALAWFGEYWSVVGMIGVVLVSLMMLKSMIRFAPPTPESRGAMPRIAQSTTQEDETPASAATAAPRLRRFTSSGPSLRDELSELVKEDPDTAANILRGWISNAG